MRAVAALQPMRTADSDFRDALEELTGRAFDQIVPHLSRMGGRRESCCAAVQTYRVVPDLLGDALLARAASARETGSAHRLYRPRPPGGQGAAMANLIVNASRIDWQEIRFAAAGLSPPFGIQ